jgi:hypothetical protein
MKYLYLLIFLLIIGLLGSTFILYQNNQQLKQKLSVSVSNEKAYSEECVALKNRNLAFQFTVQQLNYLNDSLITQMNNVRRELKIKDNDLKQMQYRLTEISKIDTLYIRDTIFRDAKLNIDTLICDDWYKLNVHLEYPNIIGVNPSFNSETYIITHYKKETINPPKKFFLARWFQKKHKVLEVEIIESNPYIEEKKTKFIEIIQ